VTIHIRAVTAHIGAEITGVDLRESLTDAEVAAIRQAWLDHLVLFFRDQHLDDDQHLAFALRFGTLDVSPLVTRYQDSPSVVVLDQGDTFGPFVAGPKGVELFEVMMGDPRSFSADPEGYERFLAERNVQQLPNPPIDMPGWLQDTRSGP